jgi:acyl-CoA synthetase (AMP-forming)/AMP-acid ligase II
VLDPVLARDPERLALVGRHGRYSYRELDREANRAAHALRELGIARAIASRRVLPNDVAIAVAFLACMRLGALWVGINRVLAPREKVHILDDSGATLLLAPPDVHAEVSGAGERLAARAHRVRGSGRCRATSGAQRSRVRRTRGPTSRSTRGVPPRSRTRAARRESRRARAQPAQHPVAGRRHRGEAIYPAGAAQGACCRSRS